MNPIIKLLKKPKFELFIDSVGEYRFRLVAPNGKIVLSSEGYTSRHGAKKGIRSIKRNAKKAKIVDV